MIVRIAYEGDPRPVIDEFRALCHLEDVLIDAIERAGVGEYDGHEIALDGSDAYLFMYGPDADVLSATVRPILELVPWMHGAEVTLQYGPPGADTREVTVVLGS